MKNVRPAYMKLQSQMIQTEILMNQRENLELKYNLLNSDQLSIT